MAAKKRKGALKKRLNQAAARLSGWAKASLLSRQRKAEPENAGWL